MPEGIPQQKTGDPHGKQSQVWARIPRTRPNPDNRNLFLDPAQRAQDASARRRTLGPQSLREMWQRPTRGREDPQATLKRLAVLPHLRDNVEVDLAPQAMRDRFTRGYGGVPTQTQRQRVANRAMLVHRQFTDATNLDNRLAHLRVYTGTDMPDRSATAHAEGVALAAKVEAARDDMRAGRPGPTTARDMSRDGRTRTVRDYDGHRRHDGHTERDRGERSRVFSLGRS